MSDEDHQDATHNVWTRVYVAEGHALSFAIENGEIPNLLYDFLGGQLVGGVYLAGKLCRVVYILVYVLLLIFGMCRGGL